MSAQRTELSLVAEEHPVTAETTAARKKPPGCKVALLNNLIRRTAAEDQTWEKRYSAPRC